MIEPAVMVYNTSTFNTTTIKIKPQDLSIVKTLFRKEPASTAIDYSFLDEMVEKQYLKDRITMSLFNSIYRTGHPRVLPGIVWPCGSDYRSAKQGNRYPESFRRNRSTTVFSDDEGFYQAFIWAVLIALPIAGIR